MLISANQSERIKSQAESITDDMKAIRNTDETVESLTEQNHKGIVCHRSSMGKVLDLEAIAPGFKPRPGTTFKLCSVA